MSIENLKKIAQHEISARRRTRIDALGLFAVIAIVLAAVVTTV